MSNFFAFQWHITDACDQRCKHCYIFAENTEKPIASMSLQQIRAVLDNCLDFCRRFNRAPYFYITGGDPLLHPHFWDLMALLKAQNAPFTILGNPFHLTDEVASKLKSFGCDSYQMSLDGLQQTHDWFRKPGSFQITLEKLSCLKRANIRSVIMTTVSGTNIQEIPALIDTVVARQANVFAFARYCATSLEKDTNITPLQYRALLDTCYHKFQEYKNSGTYFDYKDHLWTLYLYETGRFALSAEAVPGMIYDGCNCGNCHLTICSNGDVFACRRFASKVGCVYTDKLADLWLGPMEKYRDYEAFEKCSRCELLAFCRGCPAVAYGKTQRFYAPDPQCWKEV